MCGSLFAADGAEMTIMRRGFVTRHEADVEVPVGRDDGRALTRMREAPRFDRLPYDERLAGFPSPNDHAISLRSRSRARSRVSPCAAPVGRSFDVCDHDPPPSARVGATPTMSTPSPTGIPSSANVSRSGSSGSSVRVMRCLFTSHSTYGPMSASSGITCISRETLLHLHNRRRQWQNR